MVTENTGAKFPTDEGTTDNDFVNGTKCFIDDNDFTRGSANAFDSGDGVVSTFLSSNAGSAYTSAITASLNEDTETTISFGGESELWGRAWVPSDFSNANFMLKFGTTYTVTDTRNDFSDFGFNIRKGSTINGIKVEIGGYFTEVLTVKLTCFYDFVKVTVYYTTFGLGGIKSRFVKRKWPNEEGLTAETQTQEGRVTNLIPQEKSLVYEREKVGF